MATQSSVNSPEAYSPVQQAEGEMPRSSEGLRQRLHPYSGDVTSSMSSMDMSKLIFKECVNAGGNFDFLGHVSVEKNSGLHKVVDLWSNMIVARFITWLLFAFINLNYILGADMVILQDYFKASRQRHPVEWADLHFHDDLKIFEHIENMRLAEKFIYAATLVALLEFVMVFGYVFAALVEICVFCRHRNDPDEAYLAWQAAFRLFREDLRPLASISALSTLRQVHPDLIFGDAADWMHDFPFRNCPGQQALAILSFTVSRLFYFAFGVLAFTVKMVGTGLTLVQVSYWRGGIADPLFLVLGLLNQIMEMTNLEEILQDRITIFMFGGTAGDLNKHERALKNAFFAALMRQICMEFQGSFCNNMKAVALMATLNHEDLQRLALKEDLVLKQRSVSAIVPSSYIPSFLHGL